VPKRGHATIAFGNLSDFFEVTSSLGAQSGLQTTRRSEGYRKCH
jgi:hypothetical protein